MPYISVVDEKIRMRWVRCIAHIGKKYNEYRILLWKAEGKEPLGKPHCRWELSNEMISKKWKWGVWIRSCKHDDDLPVL